MTRANAQRASRVCSDAVERARFRGREDRIARSKRSDRPASADVAAFAGDPSRAPEWYANIDSVEWKTPPPVGVGSRLAFIARFLERKLAYTYEVVDLVPGERLVIMPTAEGPLPMETTYSWVAARDERTRMTLRNRGVPAGFSRIVAPLMAAAVRRANEKDLARLKSLLEKG